MIDLVELAPLVKTFEGLAKAAELNGKPHRARQWRQAVEIVEALPSMKFTSKEVEITSK
jgi:hypothetical protein